MRKNLLILGGITVISLVAAALGHAYCREFCMLFKPIAWPFVALGIIVFRSLKKKENRK
ncbi:MAG: hypothetical protein KBT68_05685 [bacterium]|nr:hypothetical protein [Candidatus Colisoma equi]